jgi:hypothetical protein
MVEVWRTNKHLLLSQVPEGRQMHVFVLFLGNELPDYGLVHASLLKCIERIIEKINGLGDPGLVSNNV